MGCRKYSAPRHGSLQYRPKRRSASIKPAIRSYPKDNEETDCHMTGFMVYKAGMTHVIRAKEVRMKNKVHTKEVLDAVTILEAPPMVACGIVGYQKTLKGLMRTNMLLVDELDESVIRRIFQRKIEPGMKYTDLRKKKGNSEEKIKALINESDVIRILCDSKVSRIKGIGQKKGNLAEIQINGGSVEDKVKYCIEKLNKEIRVNEVFEKNEMIDTIGVTKGKGFQGSVKRWGTTLLPRKTNKGTRKVACIGAWTPSNIMYTVARSGQKGFHKRTQQNLCVYGIGNGREMVQTDFDLTVKNITPMGGFPHYGMINEDYIMLKGCVTGPCKRTVTLRKSIHPREKKNVAIKFIDTSSKIGKGRFQTSEERRAFYGITKPEVNNSN